MLNDLYIGVTYYHKIFVNVNFHQVSRSIRFGYSTTLYAASYYVLMNIVTPNDPAVSCSNPHKHRNGVAVHAGLWAMSQQLSILIYFSLSPKCLVLFILEITPGLLGFGAYKLMGFASKHEILITPSS